MQSKLYGVWAAMKQRCLNPKCKLYEHYGARGIKVYEQWSWPNGYWPFEAWAMANGYQPGLTLDRINNDGDYQPSNCRWVTRAQNLSNRRMTPKWSASLDRLRRMPKTFSPAGLEALRRNMAHARKSRHACRSML